MGVFNIYLFNPSGIDFYEQQEIAIYFHSFFHKSSQLFECNTYWEISFAQKLKCHFNAHSYRTYSPSHFPTISTYHTLYAKPQLPGYQSVSSTRLLSFSMTGARNGWLESPRLGTMPHTIQQSLVKWKTKKYITEPNLKPRVKPLSASST